MMRKILTLAVLIVSVVLMSSCDSKSGEPLSVGMCPWPGYEPIALASRLELFDKPIKIVRYSSPHEAYKAFKNGAVDLVALTIDELLKLGDSEILPKIFLVTDISEGADALVAHPNIQSIDDLKGKTVGLESSVLAQYMLKRVLDHAHGLKRSDIKTKNIEIVKQEESYKGGLADAFITFEPARSAMIKAGAHILFDSSMIPNEIVDVVAAREDVFQSRQKDIKMFKKGWFKAIDYIEAHPIPSYTIMGGFENIGADVFASSLEGLVYGSRALNEKMITKKEIIKTIEKLKTIMYENGFIKKNLRSNEQYIGIL